MLLKEKEGYPVHAKTDAEARAPNSCAALAQASVSLKVFFIAP
jgi:hypothetical protein